MPKVAGTPTSTLRNAGACSRTVLAVPRLLFFFALLYALNAAAAAQTSAQPIRIGVLAFRGDTEALARWSPTADYLTASIKGYQFQIVPLDIAAMNRAVSEDKLEFVFTNPGHYVGLETRYGVTRILTLKNRVAGVPITRYGAVIFTRADRKDINSIEDLRNRKLANAGVEAFGSFQLAAGEILRHGLDPFRDLQLISTGFPVDKVVFSVLRGEADAGSVRTGVLEALANDKQINLQDIKLLNVVKDDFPFVHSTRLYPEWPFAKTAVADDALAEKVAISLLNLAPDHPAARSGHYTGWTIPLNYSPVHALLRELQATPYENFGEATFEDVIQKYWQWILLIALGFVFGTGLLTYAYHLNRRLHSSSLILEEEVRERERAKQKLDSLNARLQHLLTATPAMIYSCEPKPTWPATFVSDNVLSQLGHSSADFLSNPQFWLDHIHPDDKQEVQAGLDVLLQEGRLHREYRFRTKDGSYRWLHDEVRLVRDERGAPLEVVGYWVDVTERIRALELARTHESELAHCLRLTTMGEMATELAHDINQPLTAARNYVQGCLLRLRSGQLDGQQLLHALEEIMGQTERAADVVRHVREFVGKERSQRADHDINKLIFDAIRLVIPEARSANIAVHTSLKAEPATANVNAIQVQQVIINIARNAFEAMLSSSGRNHALFVDAHTKDEAICVTIRDTGPGVQGSIEQLFNAFFTTKATGMGMGLSISRTIIESHGGRLWAERGEPSGMVFIFTLPIAREHI